MKKYFFSLILLLFISFISNAQEYKAGYWHFGPVYGGTFSIYPYGDDFVDNASIDIHLGAYGAYSFSDLLGVKLEGKYNFCLISEEKTKYITIPAALIFQFTNSHLGIGLQYHHCLARPDLFYNNASDFSYTSVFLEYESPIWLFDSGNYNEITSFRSLLKVGYGISSIKMVNSDGTNKKGNPFFIEFGGKYSFGKTINKSKPGRYIDR